MQKLFVSVAALLVTLLPATMAWATALTITEATDFSNTSPGSIIGTLDVGVNTISGHLSAVDDLADYFQLTLPAGLGVTEEQLTITNFSCCGFAGSGTILLHPDGTFSTTALGFLGTSFSTNTTLTFFCISPGCRIFSGPITFIDGFTSPFAEVSGDIHVTSGGYDYSIAYTAVSNGTATPVPEPASLVLLGTGLVATVSRFRRRRSAPNIPQ